MWRRWRPSWRMCSGGCCTTRGGWEIPPSGRKLGRRYQKLDRDVDRLSPLLSALRTAKDKPPAPGVLVDGGDCEEEEELVCSECEFEAESFEHLEGHRQETGH